MKTQLFAAALLSAFGAMTVGAVGAQSPGSVRLQLEPGSELTLSGTSTLHPFSCKTDKIEAFIEVDPAYKTKELASLKRPLVNVRVNIPVKSLACGNKKLESNMYKTLGADKHPTISYVMTDYEIVTDATGANTLVAKTDGKLTVSGAERPITMRVASVRDDNGVVTAKAEQSILMTDFGIKPPTFMLGALRVGNQITIRFNIKATQANVSAAVGAALGTSAFSTAGLVALGSAK